MVNVTAFLRDPSGFEGEYSYEIEDDFTSHDVYFMWEDGNYACDCNRSLFLRGLDFEESWPCGRTIRCLSLKMDGEEIYHERVS